MNSIAIQAALLNSTFMDHLIMERLEQSSDTMSCTDGSVHVRKEQLWQTDQTKYHPLKKEMVAIPNIYYWEKQRNSDSSTIVYDAWRKKLGTHHY